MFSCAVRWVFLHVCRASAGKQSVAPKVRMLPEKQSCCPAAGVAPLCPWGTLLPALGFTAGSAAAAPAGSPAGRLEIA